MVNTILEKMNIFNKTMMFHFVQIHTLESVKIQTIPQHKSTNSITNKIPKHDVKSYFVCNENNVIPKQTKTVIPIAMKTDSIV